MVQAPPASNNLPPENIRPTRQKDLTRGPFAVAKVLIEAFSGTGKRPASSIEVEGSEQSPPEKGSVAGTSSSTLAKKTQHVRLITVAPSHYGEKVRWALDLLEADPNSPIYYTEDAHPPALVAFSSVSASKGLASITPMVVFDENFNGEEEVMYESSKILQRLMPELYPSSKASEIQEFERYLGEKLGATLRCFLYDKLLDPRYYPILSHIGTAGTSKIESILFQKMLPKGLAKGMRKFLIINDDTSASSLESVREVFSEVSSRLTGNDGAMTNDYIFDTNEEKLGFTAADLTFASLASPIICPYEKHNFNYPNESMLPQAILDLRLELRATPAGIHVMNMYNKHRFGSGVQARSNDSGRMVEIKSIGRNRIPWVGTILVLGSTFAITAALSKYRNSSSSSTRSRL